MSDRRIEKVVLLEYVKEVLENSKFVIFITYSGLSVAEASELRGTAINAGAKCQVLKNRFLKLAIDELGMEVPEDFSLVGDTAVVFGEGDDPASPAKAVKEFAKNHDQVQFKGGFVEDAYVDAAGIAALADLPSKEVMLSILLGVMKGPASNLVRTLSTRKNSLVWLLENYANKLEKGA